LWWRRHALTTQAASAPLGHLINTSSAPTCKAAVGCRLPTRFMRWQEKSVLLEERASVPAQNTFISRQRDRTF
jgi:hypothetical protein